MFQLSQRCCTFAATLASVVLRLCAVAAVALLASSCTSDETTAVVEPPTADEPTNEATTDAPADSADASPPSSTSPPATGTPPDVEVEVEVEPADLSIADGLPGQIVRRTRARDTGTGEIVTSAPNGSDEVVWSLGAEASVSQPTWSSNGSQLAWSVVDRDGAAVARVDIAGTPADIERLDVDAPAFYLSWSPSDTWLAGLRNGPSGLELTMLETASNDLRVVGPGQPFFTDWGPGDSLVAAIGGEVLVDIPAASGEAAVPRSLDEPLGLFQAPIVLANSDVIITLRRGNSNEVVRLAGDTPTTLARSAGPVLLSADPLGEQLAVLTVPGENELELISFQNTPTLEPARVSIINLRSGDVSTRPEADIIAINWSPTGSHLAMLEFDGSAMTWLFTEPEADAALRSVPFVPSQEFVTSYLPFADQYDRSSTWWSPDGNAFVFAGRALNERGIWLDRIDDDQGPAFLGSGDIAFWSR